MPIETLPDPDIELEAYDALATRLRGRVVLAPMVAGAPNFKAAPHKFRSAPDGNLAAADIGRLCVLTRDFHVLSVTTPHAGTVVVTKLGANGSPEFVHLAGPESDQASAIAWLQHRFDEPPVRKLVAANDNKPLWPGIVSSGDLVRKFVPPDYAIDGIVQSGFLYSLTASTGTGKTAILLLLSALTAMGRPLGNREVRKGRVIYFAGENPDDVTMRWIGAAHHIGFDPDDIDVHFIPGTFDITKMLGEVAKAVHRIGGADLVVIDTSAAYFQGADENANVDMARHARNLRMLTTLPGSPCVLVACHPTKSADQSNLLPRGGGAFLAEVDGNLVCIRSDAGSVKLHWQGKHRGPDFEPVLFDLTTITAPGLKDSRGRDIPTVLASVVSNGEAAARRISARRDEDDVLVAIEHLAGPSSRSIAEQLGWNDATGEPHKRRAQTALNKLRKDKLAELGRDGWALTKAGVDAVSKARADLHSERLATASVASIIDGHVSKRGRTDTERTGGYSSADFDG